MRAEYSVESVWEREQEHLLGAVAYVRRDGWKVRHATGVDMH